MTKGREIAVRWTRAEYDAVAEEVRKLLRGFGRPTDNDHVGDFVDVLEGLPAAHAIDGIRRMRLQGRQFAPSPGEVRQAALDPAPGPPRLAKCPTCRYHLTACICEAIDASSEDKRAEIAALEAMLAKALGS